jgi:hypothetical protein
MLLKTPDDKSARVAGPDRRAKMARVRRRRQIAEEHRIRRAGIKK